MLRFAVSQYILDHWDECEVTCKRYLVDKGLDLSSWTVAVISKGFKGDEMAVYILARAYNIHVAVVLKDRIWYTHPDDNILETDVVLAYHKYGEFSLTVVRDHYVMSKYEYTKITGKVEEEVDSATTTVPEVQTKANPVIQSDQEKHDAIRREVAEVLLSLGASVRTQPSVPIFPLGRSDTPTIPDEIEIDVSNGKKTKTQSYVGKGKGIGKGKSSDQKKNFSPKATKKPDVTQSTSTGINPEPGRPERKSGGKEWRCSNCKHVALNLKDLRKHYVEYHPEDYRCNKCDYVCSELTNITRHMEKCTTPSIIICCPHCTRYFVSENAFHTHEGECTKVHSEEPKKKIPKKMCRNKPGTEVASRTRSKLDLGKQMLTRSQTTTTDMEPRNQPQEYQKGKSDKLADDVAGKKAKGKGKMDKEESEGEGESKITNVYVCGYCQRDFGCQEDLNYHIKNRHLQAHIKCPSKGCDKSFCNQSSAGKHFKLEHSDEACEYKCKICTKTFTYRYLYEMHLPSHKKKKPHQCADCGKGYASKQALKVHMETHSATRLECSNCSYSTTRVQLLKQHTAGKHANPKYECPKCGENFKWRSSLRAHMSSCTQ